MSKFTQIVINRYKWIILVWLVFVILMGILAIRLPSMLQGDGFEMDGEYAEVTEMTSEQFSMPVESMFLVFEDVEDGLIEDVLKEVDDLDLTSSIESPLENSDLYKEHLSYALLHFDDQDEDMSAIVTEIREAIVDENGITLTGSSAITQDINTASQRDLIVAEAIGLPIAIIVLLVAFGTIVASLVPIIIGVSAVVSTFGIMTWIGAEVNLSIFVLNIIPMLGLALSIDFALLFISRYREEKKNHSIESAVATTIQTAGRSILFSAFCVFIGLGALLFIQVDIFQSIAIGGMVVVSMAVLNSLTLLPAVLLLLGDRIDKWQVLKLKKNGASRWRAFANGVIKRPVIITISALVLLGIAIIPIKNMDVSIPQIDSLPASYDSRKAFEAVDEEYGLDEETMVYLIADRDGGWDNKEGYEEILEWESYLQEDELVGEVGTIYSVSEIDSVEAWEQTWESPMQEQLLPIWETFVQDDHLFIPVTLRVPGQSDEAQDWVREIKDNPIDKEILAGGAARFNQEIFDEIFDKIWIVLSSIIITTFIVLMIAFRSVLIPLKAIMMNIIGLGATFGILVYIFQYGHFGMEAGTIALIIPVIVFSLVFGLSMDYEVFLISRIQEEYAKTLNNDHATVEGLAITSKIITSAALIMIVLTGAFAFTDVMPVKQIGVGIAIAIAIDATIIRLMLVPSLMKLFGKWNWWMPFRKGRYQAGLPKQID